MKIAVDLTAYEILLLRAALYGAAAVELLEKEEAMDLSQRLAVERKRFPIAELDAAKAALRAKYRSINE